jgi:hypothetical protein
MGRADNPCDIGQVVAKLLHGGRGVRRQRCGLALQDHQKPSVWAGDGENADINHRLDVLQNPMQCTSLKDDEVEMS